MLGTDTTDAPAIMAMDTDTEPVDGEAMEVTMEAGEATVFTDTDTDGANRQKTNYIIDQPIQLSIIDQQPPSKFRS